MLPVQAVRRASTAPTMGGFVMDMQDSFGCRSLSMTSQPNCRRIRAAQYRYPGSVVRSPVPVNCSLGAALSVPARGEDGAARAGTGAPWRWTRVRPPVGVPVRGVKVLDGAAAAQRRSTASTFRLVGTGEVVGRRPKRRRRAAEQINCVLPQPGHRAPRAQPRRPPRAAARSAVTELRLLDPCGGHRVAATSWSSPATTSRPTSTPPDAHPPYLAHPAATDDPCPPPATPTVAQGKTVAEVTYSIFIRRAASRRWYSGRHGGMQNISPMHATELRSWTPFRMLLAATAARQ